MKNRLVWLGLSLAFLCLIFVCNVSADSQYRPLTVGSYGDDVVRIKRKMYELGYYTSSKFNDNMTEDAMSRVNQYLADQGMHNTDVLTSDIQAQIFMTETDMGSLYRDFYDKCSGDDVLRAKKYLVILGYFTADATTGDYNKTMIKAATAYQNAIGHEPTGYLTASEQEKLYTIPTPTPKPTATPAPTPTPMITAVPIGPSEEIELPALNEDHFLADKDAEPFSYASRKGGLWYYISQDVSITIKRYNTQRPVMEWLDAEIYCTPDSLPYAMLGRGYNEPGHNLMKPQELVKQFNALFAITDDSYSLRWDGGSKQGIIIRNGEIKSEITRHQGTEYFPPEDVLALFRDGSMRVFASDAHTAQEYLDMDVIDTFAFGPILVEDGEINPDVYKRTDLNAGSDPRLAIGCIEPCHYRIALVKGRISASNGCTFKWLANYMKSIGCTQALNLDGGGSIFMYFMGDLINRNANVDPYYCREVGSMFGYSY